MDRSPLAKLPAELRNHVYELALRHPVPLKLYWDPILDEFHRLEAFRPRLPLALTETCQQVRVECTQIFYAINTFIIDGDQPENTDGRWTRPIAGFIEPIVATGTEAFTSVMLRIGKLKPRDFRYINRAVKQLRP